ncbi:hypothetical protein C8Q80DRAFT_126994 [Daedaleopsis nitida]|nr:hypothetical protein C8Q80DRAFT_126994 [Daedaleopsis nitida]
MANTSTEWLDFLRFLESDEADLLSFAEILYDPTSTPSPQHLTPHSQAARPRSTLQNTVHDGLDQDLSRSISATFHPRAQLLPTPPDTILESSDGVLFYVHRSQLVSRSMKAFACPVVSEPVVVEGAAVYGVPDTSNVLNIVLHVVYDRPCDRYRPDIDSLVSAVDAMATYGIPLEAHLTPLRPMFSLILGQAPIDPIAVYALAARHDLYNLAVPVSSHLLSYPLHSLPDEYAVGIGPVYLKRLFFLHLGRTQALRRLLLPAPKTHPPTPDCDFVGQKKLAKAWSLASAYLAWDARPDLPTSAIQVASGSLMASMSCELCKTSLAQHVKSIVVQWSMVKRTI